MRTVRSFILVAVMLAATSLPCFAFTQTVGVPAGTISATVVTVGVNPGSGQVTSSTTNSFCPAGSSITVTQPNNNGSTNYVSSVTFSDANGNVISNIEIIQGDGSGGSAPKN